MKILYVGETWGMQNGPYESLFPDFLKIFTDLGHSTQFVDNKKNYLPVGGNTMWQYPNFMNRFRFSTINNRIVNHLIQKKAEEFQPDLILFLKCENVYFKTISWLKRNTKSVLFNWDHDNPFWPSNTSIHLLKSIPLLDHFGIWTNQLFPALKMVGCQDVVFLPMFFNQSRFPATGILRTEKIEFDSDIAFIGIGSAERAAFLRKLTKYNLAIWGDWSFLQKGDPLLSCVRGKYLAGKDYLRAINGTKIGINVLNQQCLGASNTRTFEVTGMGGFLMTEYSYEQAEVLFQEDKEIVCFKNEDEMIEKVDYYLKHDKERLKIAQAGQLRSRNQHTLFHRLKKIVDLI